MGAVALDASVAIGFLDPTDALHERAVSSLRETDRDELLIAASAYSEILVWPLAKGHADLVEEFIDGLRVEVVPLSREIARVAAELRAAHSALRLDEAIVLATARHREAALFTFDERLRNLAKNDY